MADYGTQWSALIPFDTVAERDWLMDELTKELSEYDGTPACWGPQVQDNNTIWVWDDGWTGGNIDRLLEVVAAYQKEFGRNAMWTLEWSHTCSKPRLDAFGGGAAVIYKGEIERISTMEWVWKKMRVEV